MDEMLDVVDEQDRVIGRAPRSACHGDPSKIHRVVHVLLFNRAGEILLQLRGRGKRIQPGKWDTSAGGHLASGEGYDEAVRRELEEELGVTETEGLVRLYDYLWRSPVETERVRTFLLVHEGPFRFPSDEIEALRFWPPPEVEAALGRGVLTPNFEVEWARYREMREKGAETG